MESTISEKYLFNKSLTRNHIQFLQIITALVLLVSLTACATVKGTVNEPKFNKFTTTIYELSKAIDDQSAALPSVSKDRFKRDLLEELADEEFDGEDCTDSLLVQAQLPNTVNTSGNLDFECAPFFLEVARFRLNISLFMSEMINYGHFLEKLAARELTDIGAVKQEAANINTGISSALIAIHPSGANLVNEIVPLITNKALEHLEATIRNQQIDDINRAIVEGQAGVQSNILHLQKAIAHLGKAYIAEQNEQWQDLQPNLFDDNKRKSGINSVIEYTENRWKVFQSLKNLQAAAQQIPRAHQALSIRETPGSNVDRFASYIGFAKELQTAVKSAKIEDKKDVLQAEADKANDLASEAETEAKQAQLMIDKTRVTWTAAVIKANNSDRPSDRQAADELDKQLKELISSANIKHENATLLRSAAKKLQETVDTLKKELDE